MKNKLLLILGIASAFSLTSAKAILITDFGSISFTPTFSDFASNIQTPNQITLDGTEGNLIFGDLSAPVNILNSTESLTITGIYTGTYTGQFVVELFDADGDSLAYNGFYSNFTPNVSTTVNLVFVDQTGSFNGSVTLVGFTAGTTGGSASVDLVVSNLSAVPEPGTAALITGALTTALVFRRRRNA